MTNFEENIVKQHKVRDFMLTGAFYLAAAATVSEVQAQTSVLPERDVNQEKNKTTLTHNVEVGFNNLSALVVDEKTTTFYNNFQPYLNASIEDNSGHRASVSALELVIYDGKTTTPILTKFMVELDKKLKDGGELFLKIGRENTQGGDVFPNSIEYTASAKDIVPFGNGMERMVLGYQKNGNFVELGIIQDKGAGKYVLIPNLDEADFWGKGHLSLLAKSGAKLEMEGAVRLGKHQKLGILSATYTNGGFGAKALVERDFNNDDTKSLVRAYQNLKNGSKIIGEIVQAGKGKDVDLRLGLGKKGMQVFAQYNTSDKKAQIGASYLFGAKRNISKKTRRAL